MKNETYYIITYGCQMNENDSERIAGFLNSKNLKLTNLKTADFVILNLCSVRQKAIDKVWGKINQIKKENKFAKIILTGCILPEDKNKFKNKVDYILDINELPVWDKIVTSCQLPVTGYLKNYFSIQPKYNSKHTAYIPIMTGCNNFCSYCAVPYTRGREKSRPAQEVLSEVNKLVVQGYKHIILLGQNVNSYHSKISNFQFPIFKQSPNSKFKIPNSDSVSFSDLLKMINFIPGNYWLSFITSHPKDMSDDLIQCFKNCQHLIPYLHLPLQSGSDKILKLMNRKYTAKKYLTLIDKVKKINPNINLSTDIIVGFPGETKTDFNATKKIMRQVKYDMAYINKYSPRSGTVAAKLIDNISRQEKKRRENELTDILKKTALAKNKKMIGKEIEVLIEKIDKQYLFGTAQNFKHIKITTNNKQLTTKKNLIGKLVKVKIVKASSWSLEGKIVI